MSFTKICQNVNINRLYSRFNQLSREAIFIISEIIFSIVVLNFLAVEWESLYHIRKFVLLRLKFRPLIPESVGSGFPLVSGVDFVHNQSSSRHQSALISNKILIHYELNKKNPLNIKNKCLIFIKKRLINV